MGSVNKAMILGRLGRDPEVTYTPSGQPRAYFTMATNETWSDRDGKRQERTEWHRVVVWGKLAEICGQYLTKGRQVYIEGRIQTREWQDRDGNKRNSTEIVARDMVMLGGRGEEGGAPVPGGEAGGAPGEAGGAAGEAGGAPGEAGGAPGEAGGAAGEAGPAIQDDDIPF